MIPMDRKYEIYNDAITLFNLKPLTDEEWEETSNSKTRTIMDLNLNKALDMVRRESAWSFLQEELFIGDDEGEKAGYAHSYALSCDVFRVCKVICSTGDELVGPRKTYRLINGYILSEEPVRSVIGMNMDLPFDNIPNDFYVLVAYALAIKSHLAFGQKSDVMQAIYTMYNQTLKNLKREDMIFNRRDNVDA